MKESNENALYTCMKLSNIKINLKIKYMHVIILMEWNTHIIHMKQVLSCVTICINIEYIKFNPTNHK